eukprot:165530-Chlamydomonas_euryale.AAC.1
MCGRQASQSASSHSAPGDTRSRPSDQARRPSCRGDSPLEVTCWAGGGARAGSRRGRRGAGRE